MPPAETVRRARELRKRKTLVERRLWRYLSNGQVMGYKLRRQEPIGAYIVDFFCARTRLVVEVDGPAHDQVVEDLERDRWFERRGYRVLRLPAEYVYNDVESAVETIVRELGERASPPSAPLQRRGGVTEKGRSNGTDNTRQVVVQTPFKRA